MGGYPAPMCSPSPVLVPHNDAMTRASPANSWCTSSHPCFLARAPPLQAGPLTARTAAASAMPWATRCTPTETLGTPSGAYPQGAALTRLPACLPTPGCGSSTAAAAAAAAGASSCGAWGRTCPGTTLRSSTRMCWSQPSTRWVGGEGGSGVGGTAHGLGWSASAASCSETGCGHGGHRPGTGGRQGHWPLNQP